MDILIEYKGHLHFFKNTLQTPEHIFYDRCWFIVKNKHKPDSEAIADLWISQKYCQCSFPEETSIIIKEYEANMDV